jgi:putative intracellular protease/amidase/RimJ/RimL family protein N-acetyltransferase
MRKEVLVYVFDGFADWETAYVCAELNTLKDVFEVKTVGADHLPQTSMGGFRIIPDYSPENAPQDFALLILPGGTAWAEGKNLPILRLVDYAVKKGIPVGAICGAVDFMAQNGYLDSVLHTGNTLKQINLHAPNYKGKHNFRERQAVQDKNIITANGSAALEFAREIMSLLNAKHAHEILQWYKLHKNGFYTNESDDQMKNVYEECPVFENEQFLLRAVAVDDCADLLKVYSDEKAVPLFNSDNCHGDHFHYTTRKRMSEAIDFWRFSYENKYFVRWTIVDKSVDKAVGTIELFNRKSDDSFHNCGILRLDLRSDYENSEAVKDILTLILKPAYALFHCERIATKAVPAANERISALRVLEFELTQEKLIGHDGTVYGDYYTISNCK